MSFQKWKTKSSQKSLLIKEEEEMMNSIENNIQSDLSSNGLSSQLASNVIPSTSSPTSVIKSMGLALLVGCTISMYSIVDNQGVKVIDPLTYLFLENSVTVFFSFPYIYKYQYAPIVYALENWKWFILFVGIFSGSAYLLILIAFTQTNASYVVALRETSVVIGSILGFLILKEKFSLLKAFGVVCITFGLIFVKIA